MVVLYAVYPTFVKTPQDVSVRAGTTARLDCAAAGVPTPEIALQKDGGNDFPAARERRMHIFPSDEMFFIVNAKLQDQGVYTCTARNDVGLITANATLHVLGNIDVRQYVFYIIFFQKSKKRNFLRCLLCCIRFLEQ